MILTHTQKWTPIGYHKPTQKLVLRNHLFVTTWSLYYVTLSSSWLSPGSITWADVLIVTNHVTNMEASLIFYIWYTYYNITPPQKAKNGQFSAGGRPAWNSRLYLDVQKVRQSTPSQWRHTFCWYFLNLTLILLHIQILRNNINVLLCNYPSRLTVIVHLRAT